MSSPTNKIFLLVDDQPILGRTLEVFDRMSIIESIILVVAESDRAACTTLVRDGGYRKVRQIVGGGDSRHASERLGLLAIADEVAAGSIDVVLVHDAVRPFVAPDQIDAVVAEARRTGAAILAVPAGDRVVVAANDGTVLRTGADLWVAQTPQAFDASVVLEAHRRAAEDGFTGTDTAAVVERMGHPVTVVEGRSDNIKITTADDLIRAELIAQHPGEGADGRSAVSITPRI